MKKIKALLILLFLSLASTAQVAKPCTTDVYLQRVGLENNLAITNHNGHKSLVIDGTCFVLGPEDLIMECDSATGVHVDTASGEMLIPEYYTVELHDYCTGEEKLDAYKQLFELSSGDPLYTYTYIYPQGITFVNALKEQNPAEWDSIVKFGKPSSYTMRNPDDGPNDTTWIPNYSLVNSDPFYFDPYYTCKTGVAKNFSDAYWNYINIDSVPDGLYNLDVKINLPAYVYDPSIYPNKYHKLVRITGWTLDKHVQPINCCTLPVPNSPTGLNIRQSTLVWNSTPNATSYNVYRALGVQGQGGWSSGVYSPVPIGQTTGTSFILPQVPSGMYFYSVSAVNCKGESAKTESKKIKQ